jgi:hypothetical protein
MNILDELELVPVEPQVAEAILEEISRRRSTFTIVRERNTEVGRVNRSSIKAERAALLKEIAELRARAQQGDTNE